MTAGTGRLLHFIPTSDLASALCPSKPQALSLLLHQPSLKSAPNNKGIGIQVVVEGKPEAQQDDLTIFCVGLLLGRGKIQQISFQEGRGRWH
jgi:hypothetical protein